MLSYPEEPSPGPTGNPVPQNDVPAERAEVESIGRPEPKAAAGGSGANSPICSGCGRLVPEEWPVALARAFGALAGKRLARQPSRWLNSGRENGSVPDRDQHNPAISQLSRASERPPSP